tara:strand:+ start:440 stop:868 length:429 start_codon:yes stop_codon:yes gene_type:complete
VKSEKNINNIFDWLTEITYNKRPWSFFTKEEQGLFVPFLVHRFVSMNSEYIDLVDTIQKYSIEKRITYQFYCDALPKKKQFFRYIKPKKSMVNEELISILAKRFQLSKREIKDNYHLIGKDLSKDILQNMGIDEKQIKKLLK